MIYESVFKKVQNSNKDIESDIDSEIFDYKDKFFKLMQTNGFVVNEESKGLFPSSMTIRPLVWSDGFKDRHVVGNICLDGIEEERSHQPSLQTLDLDKCCWVDYQGQKYILENISYQFEKIWFCLGYIHVFKNHHKKLLSKMVEIDEIPNDVLGQIYNYCNQMYGSVNESVFRKVKNVGQNEIEKEVDSEIGWKEGDFYPNKENREGVVIFDGKDGKHPLTICALKFSSQVKRGKKTSEFTFKEAVKEDPKSKRGCLPSYKIKKGDEWYVPSAEELEHLGLLIEKQIFTIRLGSRLWSSDRSDFMSDFLAKSINVCTYDIELLNSTKCSDSKLEWKCRILPFRQITQ